MKDATRDRVLREAANEFARLGYDGASLRKIAERVGIRAASVYSHFPDGKTQLYQEILDTVSALLTERIANRYGQNTGLAAEDVIVQMCAAFWDFCQDHPEFATLLLRESFDAERSPFLGDASPAREVVATAMRYVEAAQGRGELRGFDVEDFSLWVASYMLGFHGAAGLRHAVQRGHEEPSRARARFIAMVRCLLRGTAIAQPEVPAPAGGHARTTRPKRTRPA